MAKFPFAATIRGLFLVSWVMPGLVVGALWGWILAGDFGVLNAILEGLGLIDSTLFWKSDPSLSIWAVTIANIWLGLAFNMMLLSVGLAAIPRDLYEAAELDGANGWQRFSTITLPMMRATIGAVLALGLIYTLQQFDLFPGDHRGRPGQQLQRGAVLGLAVVVPAVRLRQGRDGVGDDADLRAHRLDRLCLVDPARGARMTRLPVPRLLLVLALVLAAIYLFPLYWMYVTSLKGQSEIFANPPTFWPRDPDPSIYPETWQRRTMGMFLWNSSSSAPASPR